LLFKNEPAEGSDYYGPVKTTHGLLRVMESVRAAASTPEAGNRDVFALYWEFGSRIHHDRELDFDAADALTAVGLDTAHAAAVDDEQWDATIRRDMDDGLAIVGTDVGTPIIAMNNSRGDRVGYFGPVITQIPPTAESLKMWDALVAMMDVDGFFELKKTRTMEPDPGDRPDPVDRAN
jgi:hypothetical protein